MATEMTHTVYNPHQLSVLIETLAHEAVNKNSKVAEEKLKALYSDLNGCFDMANRANFEKIRLTLIFLEGNYLQVQEMIRTLQFEEHHHSFLRDVYKSAELRIKYKNGASWEHLEPLILYPSHIEKKDEDGIPMSVAKYIKDYYSRQKFAKKAINVKKIAEETKLPESVVSRRLNFHRDKMSIRVSSEASKFKKPKTKDDAPPPHQLLDSVYSFPNDYLFPYLPSPPMTDIDMFPTHRIPLDQPLTIIIPN